MYIFIENNLQIFYKWDILGFYILYDYILNILYICETISSLMYHFTRITLDAKYHHIS